MVMHGEFIESTIAGGGLPKTRDVKGLYQRARAGEVKNSPAWPLVTMSSAPEAQLTALDAGPNLGRVARWRRCSRLPPGRSLLPADR